MKELFIFDFDGTLYNGDSMLDFAKFIDVKKYYIACFISGVLFPFVFLKLMSRQNWKRIFLSINFKTVSHKDLGMKANQFFKIHQEKLFDSALVYIQNIDRQESKILIVSASCSIWVQPFADFLAADLIATELEFSNEIFTGRILGANVSGQEKVNAIARKIDLSEFETVHSFGNSRLDKVLKTISTNYYHKKFSA